MSPNRGPAASATTGRSRRRLLVAAGAAAAGSLAGCSVIAPADGPEGEGDTIEVVVHNRTDDPARVGVRVEDDEGAALVSRVYSLDPGRLDESAGIDATPATIRAFTPDGTAAVWSYAPDLNQDCEGEDIGITLTEDEGFESWYGC